MKYRVFSTLFVAMSLAGATAQVSADSPALQRAQEAASKVDLTQYFQSSSDARSQSFLFGGLQQHPFTVAEAGTYRFSSSILPGESPDYRITAKLIDANGNVIERGEGLGTSGGLEMEEHLEPGDYRLQVSGQKFGTTKTGGNSFNITVDQIDAGGNVIAADEGGVDDGGGRIMFGGASASGRTTAFVDSEDEVATLSAPGRRAAEDVAASGAVTEASPEGPDFGTANTGDTAMPPAAQDREVGAPENGVAAAADELASDRPRTGRPERPALPQDGFDEIVADIRILQQGEVLSFDVAETGTVSIASSTFPGNEGTYRLEAEVLDADGNVVASDAGNLAIGDFDIETVLEPGRYTVSVQGQRFGSAMGSANRYTLRVKQLDTQ
ncbi:hypothetical protein [Salinicola avicenniae]|uniref:hypothetical protein n=1 Tax=Salinicola avicenniae TaxID=2916836 RepID=UPI00207345DD|nr:MULTISPECIES: hypothetical protein [unclassified Salinicola]